MKIKYLNKLLIIFSIIIFPTCNQKSKDQINHEEHENQVKIIIEKTEAENVNLNVTNQFVSFGTDTMIKIELKNFVQTPRLILYFSSNTCSPCIEHTIELIEKLFPDYKRDEKIVFMSQDYPTRYRNNCYGKKLLILEYLKLGLPLEKSIQPPFFLIINDKLKITHIHIVNKNDFGRTEEFLNKVYDRFHQYFID